MSQTFQEINLPVEFNRKTQISNAHNTSTNTLLKALKRFQLNYKPTQKLADKRKNDKVAICDS